ncbi:hypothetical protein XENOCAPTIV_010887 [Xenoophorus captivus]|uniref:Uncharacterized protein n=1 Tax=Xenoophorus captivus TaxID=1517983 RepID=A0ABV0S8U3_9TELE
MFLFTDHSVIIFAKDSPDTKSTDRSEVPVSVVDMDVPVTTIDEPPVIGADLVQHNTQSSQQKKSELSAKVQRSLSPGKEEVIHKVNQISSNFSASHGKINRSVTSRFGMKTFTVVPPKPSVTDITKTHPNDPGSSFSIKIDDQGNMVTAGIQHLKYSESPKSEIENVITVSENAKAFWSSNKTQEHLVTQRKGQVDNSTYVLGTASAVSLEEKLKTSKTKYEKTSAVSNPTVMVQTKMGVEDIKKQIDSPNSEHIEVESKMSVSNNVQRPSNKPSLPPPLHSDRKQQLNFVKPSRRTSSQYVASALTKYTPKISTKPSCFPKIADSSESLKTEKAAGFQKSVTPFQSSQVSLSDITENDSTSTITVPCSKSFMSFPESLSHSQRDSVQVKMSRKKFGNDVVAKKEDLDTADKELAKKNRSQCNGSPEIEVTSNSNGDYIKHIQSGTPNPAKSSAPHSSFKPPIAPKIKPHDQISVSNILISDISVLTNKH